MGRSSSILECKSILRLSILSFILVEVAPYWNVNKLIVRMAKLYRCVEVAPYWNVNATSAGVQLFNEP